LILCAYIYDSYIGTIPSIKITGIKTIRNGNKETRKNNKQYNMRAIRAADLARLEHARMHEALRN
jgi:hypothetical protein